MRAKLKEWFGFTYYISGTWGDLNSLFRGWVRMNQTINLSTLYLNRINCLIIDVFLKRKKKTIFFRTNQFFFFLKKINCLMLCPSGLSYEEIKLYEYLILSICATPEPFVFCLFQPTKREALLRRIKKTLSLGFLYFICTKKKWFEFKFT